MTRGRTTREAQALLLTFPPPSPSDCPWVGNCVGWANYKAFVQLLFFGYCATIVTLAWWIPLASGVWRPLGAEQGAPDPNSRFDWQADDVTFAAIIIACTYAFMLTCFTGAHVFLITSAMTTIESASGVAPSPYSHESRLENFRQVFGASAFFWFSPAPSPDVVVTTCEGADFFRSIAAAKRGDPPALREYLLQSEIIANLK